MPASSPGRRRAGASLPARLLLPAGGLLAGALLLSACGSPAASNTSSSSSTSAPATTSTALSTSTSAPPASASSSSTTSTTSTSAPASSTTNPSGSVPTNGGAGGCATASLRLSLGTPNGAAGSTYLALQFTNTASTPCILYGYPGVSAVTGPSGSQVGEAAARSPGGSSPSVVTLGPGATAAAQLRVVDVGNYSASTCVPRTVAGLRVYPPGDSAAAFVPMPSLEVCSRSVPGVLGIGPVTSGSAGSSGASSGNEATSGSGTSG